MKEKIRVIVKDPDEDPRYETVENKLSEFQRIVGGYIECQTLAPDVVVIMDEEGRLKNKKYNMLGCVGTIVFAGIDGPEFDDVPAGLYRILTK